MSFNVLNSNGAIRVRGTGGATGATGPTGPTGVPLVAPTTVQVSTSSGSVSTTGYANITGLSGAITPVSTGSRIQIQAVVNTALSYTATGANPTISFQVTRGNGGTVVGTFNAAMGVAESTVATMTAYLDCIDSPSTVTGVTYYVQIKHANNVGAVHDVNYVWNSGSLPVSVLTLTELRP